MFCPTVPDVQLVHEAGNEFQGFLEVGGTNAQAAVEEDRGIQLGRQACLGDGESTRLLAMHALEISLAFAEVAVTVGEAIAAVLTRPLGARIDDHLLTAATAGPTGVADARGDAICCHAAAVTAMNAGAVIDSLAAVTAAPSNRTEAGRHAVAAVDASTIAAVRLSAWIEEVALADET